jgi:hypothetical protein
MDEEDPHRKMTPRASGGRSIDFSRGSIEAMKLASYHAKLILGSYRADQANDPDVYITAITHLLARYAPDIGARLTDPKDGVAGKYKFLPTVSEVREEAEKLVTAERDDAYRQAELQKQWELRDRVEAEDKAEPLEYRQKVAQRILREIKEAYANGEAEPYNVFVPTFAPQYADMQKRGGRSGHSLDDKNRSGVWVPLSWLQGQRRAAEGWKQFSADELLAKYPPKGA